MSKVNSYSPKNKKHWYFWHDADILQYNYLMYHCLSCMLLYA